MKQLEHRHGRRGIVEVHQRRRKVEGFTTDGAEFARQRVVREKRRQQALAERQLFQTFETTRREVRNSSGTYSPPSGAMPRARA